MSQAFRHQGLHALGGISKELKAQRERREAAEQARKEAEAAAERSHRSPPSNVCSFSPSRPHPAPCNWSWMNSACCWKP